MRIGKIIEGAMYSKAGWLSILGVTFQWKHKKNRPLFSERYGHVKFTRIPLTPFRIRMKDKD